MRFVQKKQLFQCLYLALAVILFALGYIYKSYLETAFALCGFLFFFGQSRLVTLLPQAETVQEQKCKPVGFFLCLPSMGMILIGVAFFFFPQTALPVLQIYGAVGLSAFMAAYHIFWLINLRKSHTVAARFLRLANWMTLSLSASLCIVLILIIMRVEEADILGCLSIVVFGGLALLLALSMVVISLCGYKRLKESIYMILDLIRKNRLIFTRFSVVKDIFLVGGKGIISVLSSSFFMCVNALYSAGMGLARFVAIKMHKQDRKAQVKSYRMVGFIITAASICYSIYSLRLLFGGTTRSYSINTALVIALYTFIEFGINVRDALRLRKSHALEAKALRAIGFASTLICFVLTQTAITSFASDVDMNFANALSGMFFGGAAALIGIFVIAQSFYYG